MNASLKLDLNMTHSEASNLFILAPLFFSPLFPFVFEASGML